MEELLKLILEEIRIERKFYNDRKDLFNVEDRAIKALSMLLIKVQGRVEVEKIKREAQS